MRPGREPDHSNLSSAKAKYEWSYALVACVGQALRLFLLLEQNRGMSGQDCP